MESIPRLEQGLYVCLALARALRVPCDNSTDASRLVLIAVVATLLTSKSGISVFDCMYIIAFCSSVVTLTDHITLDKVGKL